MRPVLAPAFLLFASAALAAPLPVLPGDVTPPDDAPDGVFFDPHADAPAIRVPGDKPPVAYIVNGVEAKAGEYPEVVFLEIESDASESTCTGSLIDPSWVLTAGHCIAHEDKKVLATGVTVKFGNVGASASKAVPADNWFAHPKWDPTKFTFEGDVALVHLAEPVNDVFVMALNEQPMDSSWLRQELTFIGFGITTSGGTGAGIKRYVDEPISGIPSSFLVNTFDGLHSTCQGDSGGPGVLKIGGGYVQATVTSHGIGCGEGKSGHMRVDNYINWIRDSIEPFGGSIVTTPAAPPTFECSRQVDPTKDDSTSVGIVPFDLVCALRYSNVEDLTKITWSWGDGTTDTSDTVVRNTVHRYTTPGSYTVRMCVEGIRHTEGGDQVWDHCVQRPNLVRSCDLADVAFQVVQEDGLTYKFLNYTNLRTSNGCVFNVQWDIFAGDDLTAAPVDSIRSWEPDYTFADPGEYTVVLNVGGIAGTSAAKATFKARPIGGTKSTCDQTGLPAGVLLALGALAALRRRKD